MPMVVPDTLQKVVYLTQELNMVVNIEKTKALKTLAKFDIEWSENRQLVKHYPLDDMCFINNPEQLLSKLENMSNAFWMTFNHYVEQAIGPQVPVLETQVIPACEWGERQPEPKKIGKIYTCQPARFMTINKPTEVLQPYLYSYDNLKEDRKELMGEINFGIEIY